MKTVACRDVYNLKGEGKEELGKLSIREKIG